VENLNCAIPEHPVQDRRPSDVEFFTKLAGYGRLNEENVSHEAIHDAESIFWVIIFFMVRANPKGSDIHKNMSRRSETFDAIVGHDIGIPTSTRESHFMYFPATGWADMLPEKLAGFSRMLQQLWGYFSFPWRGVEVPVKHQFHAHSLLQRLIIREIKRLTQEMKDPIELDSMPLPVHSRLAGTQRTGTLGNSMRLLSHPKRSQTEDSSEAPFPKRGKHKHAQAQDGDACPFVHCYT
jgi:hypothetical protein